MNNHERRIVDTMNIIALVISVIALVFSYLK